MALPIGRSLRHMRGELQTRLGFSNQVLGSQQKLILQSFFDDAQHDIFWTYKYRNTRIETQVNTVAGTKLYDWPDNVDPRRAIRLKVYIDNAWQPVLRQSIEWDRDTVTSQGFPQVYDPGPQLELWPIPDAIYDIEIEHYPRLGLLVEPDAWAASTAYSVGDVVQPATGMVDYPAPWPTTAHQADYAFTCSTAGTTGSSEPTWTSDGTTTVSDGSVVWTPRLNVASVPDELLFKLALYKAKLHYKQQDAQEAFGSFQVMLNEMNGGDVAGERFIRGVGHRRGGRIPEAPWIPPTRV